MDFEILRVKLEIERIRLLAWGSAVGLGNNHPDYRLDGRGTRHTIVELLGCVEHVFSSSEKLQKRYGLRQEAAADAHGDISETASLRREALGATASAQSVISADAWTLTERNAPKAQPVGIGHESMKTSPAAIDPKEEELERQMDAVEKFMTEKENGALTCSLFCPRSYSVRVTSFIHWTGEDSETGTSFWSDRDKGFVAVPHTSFGVCSLSLSTWPVLQSWTINVYFIERALVEDAIA